MANKVMPVSGDVGPSRRFRPAPLHNPLKAPAVCLCVGCSEQMLDLRCPAERDGTRCGDYSGHKGEHSKLEATVFAIAEERVRLDKRRVNTFEQLGDR